MNDQKGLLQFVYIIALLLLGIIIWGFFQSKTANLTELSVTLDNELNDTLNAEGFVNSDLVGQYREERRSGSSVWIEYYREMKLPKNLSQETLKEKLLAVAQKHGCTLSALISAGSRSEFDIYYGRKLFSKLVLEPSRLSPSALAGRRGRRIAVVIDDVGYKNDLGPFLDVGIPITFAILPHERFSKTIAFELTAKGMPYILHLPLEPERYPAVDPGKAALLIRMTDSEIESKFLSDLASVPGVSGVSNHMGSRFSANAEKMRILLKLVKAKNLFYFDSYTSSSTKAGRVAREIGIPFAENSIFVDLEDNPEFMKKQFGVALKLTKKYGSCAVIGHISKKSLPGVLREASALFKANGVEFVYLPEIISTPGKR